MKPRSPIDVVNMKSHDEVNSKSCDIISMTSRDVHEYDDIGGQNCKEVRVAESSIYY